MRCNFCGRNLTKDEEEYEDDSKGLNYEILQACSNNSSDTVNSIEYLLIYQIVNVKHHMVIYGLLYVMEENMFWQIGHPAIGYQLCFEVIDLCFSYIQKDFTSVISFYG